MTVVTMLPANTTSITGLRICGRRSSLRNASMITPRTIWAKAGIENGKRTDKRHNGNGSIRKGAVTSTKKRSNGWHSRSYAARVNVYGPCRP
jgi:hypothetical protein